MFYYNVDFKDIKDIVLIFILLSVIYLLFFKKTSIQIVDNKELSTIIPTTNTISPTTTASNNVKINGDLEVFGNVKFVNKNINKIEVLPRGTIIIWDADITLDKKPPKGWAHCNGKRYKLDENGNAVITTDDDTDGYTTRDLQTRFIYGAGKGNNNTHKPYNFGMYDGSDLVTLDITQIPKHTHQMNDIFNYNLSYFYNNWENIESEVAYVSYKNKLFVDYTGGDPNNNNETKPHNNLPPFCALHYIVKL